MPKTLLTGANGFVAAHVLDQLIAAGHSVTGQVRSDAKGQQILDTHPEYQGKLDFVVVPDYTQEGTWDKVFQNHDFDYVVHTAAPLLDNPGNTDFDKHFLEPSVKGNTELLKSAHRYGKSVKAIAVTGSINSMTTGQDIATRVFTSDSWLPLSIDDARKANHPYISYCVGKAEADKAIWSYISNHSPPFTVSVLLPALIFGPPIQPVTDLKKINYSNNVFYSLFNGSNDVTPPTSFPSYIDVRDLAYAHIKSLTTPAVANHRFLIGGAPYSSQSAVDALKTVPELSGRLPRDSTEVVTPVRLGDVHDWNARLGLKVRSTVETFGDAARRILELEKIMPRGGSK